MSHEIAYDTYPENCNKNNVERKWDSIAAKEGWREGSSGLCSSIRWIDCEPCDSYNDAVIYVQEHDKGNYDCLAVRYRDYSGIKEPKIIGELTEKIKSKRHKLYTMNNDFYFDNIKSQFIGCKECGSKISVKYLKRNTCPVCGNDMRPQTFQDRIKKISNDLDVLEKKREDEVKKFRQKRRDKAKICWLVKVEYHT